MTYDEVRRMVLAWPGVEDGTSYGVPSLKIKGKFFTRLKEDGDSLVIKNVDPDERDMLIEAAPDIFYVTDHYKGWPTVLMRLSKAHPDQVKALLLRSWKASAPKRLVKEFEQKS
jgi:hypothetical protein